MCIYLVAMDTVYDPHPANFLSFGSPTPTMSHLLCTSELPPNMYCYCASVIDLTYSKADSVLYTVYQLMPKPWGTWHVSTATRNAATSILL
jgi:hypothetical protein